MILKSVRVENFKCVEDSTEFSIAPVTCLVGKNESGKTALLQALYKLKPAVHADSDFDPLIEYPRRKWSEYKERHETSPDNVVTTHWELEDQEHKALAAKLGPKCVKSSKLTMKKGYDNRQCWTVGIDEKEVIRHYLAEHKLEQAEFADVNNTDTIEGLIEALQAIKEPSDRHTSLLSALQEDFRDGSLVKGAIDVLSPFLPTFLYFSQYHNMPGVVAISELQRKKNANQLSDADSVFLALLNLAGTTPEVIDEIGKFEELFAELEAISNHLTAQIFEYWSQNTQLEVIFTFDNARPQDPPPLNQGYIFRTRIANRRHGVSVIFDERSTGFVWFFSFLVWFSQLKKNYGENLVILLDDPGLGLHARAQADLLRYINEKLRPDYQVIYTTHSPFMVDPENLLSARTVEDVIIDESIQGTKVGDKVFSTDADTVFPLQAALGYDITQTLFVGKDTLLVEGPSDLLYLKWFSRQLKTKGRECLDPRWVISPCGGIDKVSSFMALFGGSKLNVVVLTDFHKGLKTKVRNIKESNLLRRGHIFSADMYVDQAEADIEDLLGRDFYIDLVNKCYSLQGSHRLAVQKPADAPTRVVQEVGEHFATLPPEITQFDHLEPASFLMENTAELGPSLAGLDQALGRFESLFKDVNTLLD